MPKVVVLGTGGTIASRVDPKTGHAVAAATGVELVETMRACGHAAPAGIEVAVEQFCNVNSFRFDLEIAFRIAKRAASLLADPEILGVVVTQGTDTMEESSYLADLVVGSEKPVVFTGAQRHAQESDSDGPRNLAQAIRVAAAPEARGLGAMIVFEGELHAARDATKLHASRVGTFWSGEHGKLGEVDGERVVVQRRPTLRRSFAVDRIEPRIDLVRLVMGSDARFIRCALDTGTRGLVLEAFGRGNANHEVVAGIREAVERGVPVVVTSRCPQGRVLPIYGDGGGKDVAAAGAIFAGDLSGLKARVLLSVLLGSPAVTDLAETIAAMGS
ncbi:asparaginase [Benzoatithermus flavus]|uniref:Asparaginase n=1 Tax=Benzoatithermus flavus TaxID=3108223 RepID=A0ABU8XSA1_9PROT